MKGPAIKYCLVAFSVLFLGLISSFAQEAFSVAGADVIDEGGSVCFTVGLTMYTTDSGNGSVTYGVQQVDPRCLGDFSGDGVINVIDLLQLLIYIQCDGICPGDLNNDGEINTGDVLYFLGLFGSECTP